MSLPRDTATASEAEWELAIRRSRVMDELLVRGVPPVFRTPPESRVYRLRSCSR